jgi:D-glycero-alpha-D-manno-heptose-7-phosphate kinase
MIVAKCPLRVSLAGGSTDQQAFLDKYGVGSVIGFPINLFSYIFLNLKKGDTHRIVYSKMENVRVDDVESIQNDIVRETLKFFSAKGYQIPAFEIIFESDIPSTGSGLASSSAYTVALVAALYEHFNIHTRHTIFQDALTIERTFNPLVGFQDFFQSSAGGMKRLIFNRIGVEYMHNLPDHCFKENKMYLVPTGTTRSSTKILKTLNLEECKKLLPMVEALSSALAAANIPVIMSLINAGWEEKKKTSPDIVNFEVEDVEKWISTFPSVLAKRLCGAGGGGFFLVISNADIPEMKEKGFQVQIDPHGPVSKRF